jgi:hypothetical protein
MFFLASLDSDSGDQPEPVELESEPVTMPQVTVWFVSNAAGQALKSAYSLTALREKYALSIMPVAAGFIPDEYRPYYEEGWHVQSRSLYEDGELLRTQWVFIDTTGVTRFVSAQSPQGDGFWEMYNERGFLIRESRFDAPVETEAEDGTLTTTPAEPFVIRYSYRGNYLTQAQSDAWSDVYRYTRGNLIRAIDRTYTEAGTHTRTTMPRTANDITFDGSFFVTPEAAYTSAFLQDVLANAGDEVSYELDDRGRILTETRRSADGDGAGVLSHVMNGDRIESIVWENGGDKRRVDYTYDEEGERTGEKNYRNDVLEREVVVNGEEDIETLYLNGKAVLRAVWQNGRKLREEAVRDTDVAARKRSR